MNSGQRLRTLVSETANASIAISVNTEGYYTNLGNTKLKFTNADLDKLCDEISDYIEKNRKNKEASRLSPKLFTL